MAYYKLTVDGKAYVNQQLYQVANKQSQGGIARAVADGTVVQKVLFDSLLFSIEDSKKDTYVPFTALTQDQDVDVALKRILRSTGDETATVVEIPAELNTKIYHYKGFEFVRLVDVTDPQRYRLQDKMPKIHVFGGIYVALNAKTDQEKEPVIVTIKN